MSIKFKSISHKNLQDLAAPAKHYALVEPTGTTDIDGLSAIIAAASTVSHTDVYAVVPGLPDAINQELADGRSVHLGKLGTFSLSVTSEGAETSQPPVYQYFHRLMSGFQLSTA